jgi:hypothetical protein
MPDQWHYHDRPQHSVGAQGTCEGFDDPVKSCTLITEAGEPKYKCVHGTKSGGGGKKGGGCCLVTAFTEYAGLPDDCVELQVMRSFRDTYVAKLPNGPALIDDYYEVAPTIVDHIKKDEACDSIFTYMLSQIRTIVALVQSGRHREAYTLYMAEDRKLRARYGMECIQSVD